GCRCGRQASCQAGCLQLTEAFKICGAFHKISGSRPSRDGGVLLAFGSPSERSVDAMLLTRKGHLETTLRNIEQRRGTIAEADRRMAAAIARHVGDKTEASVCVS